MGARPAEPSRPTAGDALFRPVRSGNAFEQTVERLLQAVHLGVVAPGGRLPPERELAARFGVGREKVRESLRALTAAGYLEVRRGRYGGTFVRSLPKRPTPVPGGVPDRASVLDTLTLRRVLETGAAEAAAAADLGVGELGLLRELLAQTSAAPLEQYRRLDSRLHLAVAEVTGSASLTAAVADVRMRTNDLLDAIPLLPPNIGHSDRQHAAVVEGILARDPPAARRAMAEHLDGTAMLLRGFLLPERAAAPH